MFEIDLFNKICQTSHKDFCISPFGIRLSIQALMNGMSPRALKKTEELMGITLAEANSRNKEIQEKIASRLLRCINLFWADEVPLYLDFVQSLLQNYTCDMKLVGKDRTEAVKDINGTVDTMTSGAIPQAVPSIDEYLRCIVLSLLTFEGKWQDRMYERREFKWKDRPAVFLACDSNMYDCWKTEEFTSVRIPYENEEFCLYCLMPQNESFKAAEEHWNDIFAYRNKLTEVDYGPTLVMSSIYSQEEDGTVNPIIAKKHTTNHKIVKNHPVIDLRMPKFKTSTVFSAQKTLELMGYGYLFMDEPGSLDHILKKDLRVGKVLQTCVLDVDRYGTKAATATAVEGFGITGCPMIPKEVHIECNLNRPFVYVLRHEATGELLFMGRLKE